MSNLFKGFLRNNVYKCNNIYGKRTFLSKIKEGNLDKFDRKFGLTSNNDDINAYTIKNNSGMTIEFLNYGASLRSIIVPDKDGYEVDVIIGLDNVYDYQNKNEYFGCVCGRYANRINNGTFKLNDKVYNLDCNDKNRSLHGGYNGFDKKIWKISDNNDDEQRIGYNLELYSPENDEKYPGDLKVIVQYLLYKNENILEINYIATTNSSTILNLTNHAYFNLDGILLLFLYILQ